MALRRDQRKLESTFDAGFQPKGLVTWTPKIVDAVLHHRSLAPKDIATRSLAPSRPPSLNQARYRKKVWASHIAAQRDLVHHFQKAYKKKLTKYLAMNSDGTTDAPTKLQSPLEKTAAAAAAAAAAGVTEKMGAPVWPHAPKAPGYTNLRAGVVGHHLLPRPGTTAPPSSLPPLPALPPLDQVKAEKF